MQSPAANVPFSFVLPPATLAVVHRLGAALMALADAVAAIALAGCTPTLTNADAETLFLRLARLLTILLRIEKFGIRPRSATERTPREDAPEDPAQRLPRSAVARLPRHPGWLLEALPDTAPAIASDLGRLLADPAFAPLLGAPTLHHALRPLMRGLGLTLPQAAPPPAAPPPGAPRSRPSSAGSIQAAMADLLQALAHLDRPPPKSTSLDPALSHALIVP